MYPLTYICRHGQTDWNAERRLQGQHETDINALGRAQADGNGRALGLLLGEAAGSFRFIASPMRRTRETMERIRAAMALDPAAYETDDLLKEVSFGDWQGFTLPELDAREPGTSALRDADKWNHLPPGNSAESYAMMALRVARWLETHDRQAVIVAHGGIVRALFHLVGGLSGEEASMMDVPQDRILKLEGMRLAWL